MTELAMFFAPHRDEQTGEAVLLPVIMKQPGEDEMLLSAKCVTDAEKALSMVTGFEFSKFMRTKGDGKS